MARNGLGTTPTHGSVYQFYSWSLDVKSGPGELGSVLHGPQISRQQTDAPRGALLRRSRMPFAGGNRELRDKELRGAIIRMLSPTKDRSSSIVLLRRGRSRLCSDCTRRTHYKVSARPGQIGLNEASEPPSSGSSSTGMGEDAQRWESVRRDTVPPVAPAGRCGSPQRSLILGTPSATLAASHDHRRKEKCCSTGLVSR